MCMKASYESECQAEELEQLASQQSRYLLKLLYIATEVVILLMLLKNLKGVLCWRELFLNVKSQQLASFLCLFNYFGCKWFHKCRNNVLIGGVHYQAILEGVCPHAMIFVLIVSILIFIINQELLQNGHKFWQCPKYPIVLSLNAAIV